MDNNDVNKLRQYSRKLLRELGILQLGQKSLKKTPAHWHTLIEVSRKESLTISELSGYLLLSNSATSRLVSSLVKDGMLVFKQGSDKREKFLALTEKGQLEIDNIDEFSNVRIKGACEFLSEPDQEAIVSAIQKYADALEKSRQMRMSVKVLTLSTSRTIRKQIVSMIEKIQKDELQKPVTSAVNAGILNAESEYYYNNSYNFWYAIDADGKIIGSIGLKQIDTHGAEIKKCFVLGEYRSKGVAQKLMATLAKAAMKHGFRDLYLGCVDTAVRARRFYGKYGLSPIDRNQLPSNFCIGEFDSYFLRGKVSVVNELVEKSLSLH